ncbi:hypothetical protein LB543_05035 [Mesorhizobium sp. ESP7-2]|uniref:hypothetical protein n=1 Tax=Mesorhizobium sp. ESP7-2 TaxID=2876622 RepID=UPI001CCE134E|nr:hypothetical protein [Mesorhizobium sp. ESP7-2]MBZ9706083.1 hypothetical protein [Mesorhizobium sp. ESP7-2]
MITFSPLAAYGIRFHGKMWLKMSKLARIGAEAYGWRPYSWTSKPEDAEKWCSKTAATHFAERHCRGPFEVADFTAKSPGVDQIA